MEWALGGMTLLAAYLAWRALLLAAGISGLGEWMRAKGIEPPPVDELKIYTRSVIRRRHPWLRLR